MEITFANEIFIPDASGALIWPARKMLVIADAHLEKASHFARRGYFLPPYDSHMTLSKILNVCGGCEIERVLILGDFFHDNDGHLRLPDDARGLLADLMKFEVIWIKGNHDAKYIPDNIKAYNEYEEAEILFRHEAEKGETRPEISGHFHPKSEFVYKGKMFRQPCFIEDGQKMILPAFGALTGGLSVYHPAIAGHFERRFHQYAIINEKVFRLSDELLNPA